MSNLTETRRKVRNEVYRKQEPSRLLELSSEDEPIQVHHNIENPIHVPSNLNDHETLKKAFRKNGLNYKLLGRTNKVAI